MSHGRSIVDEKKACGHLLCLMLEFAPGFPKKVLGQKSALANEQSRNVTENLVPFLGTELDSHSALPLPCGNYMALAFFFPQKKNMSENFARIKSGFNMPFILETKNA